MKRLPKAQERRLVSKVLYGHFGGGRWETNPLTYDEFHKKISLVEAQRDQAREMLKTDPHAAEEQAYIGLGLLKNIEHEARTLLSTSLEKREIVQRLRATLNQVIGWADKEQGRPIPNPLDFSVDGGLPERFYYNPPISHSLEDLKKYAAQVLAAGRRAGDNRRMQEMIYRSRVGKIELPAGNLGEKLMLQIEMDLAASNKFYTALARWLENAHRYTDEDRKHLANLAWWYVNLITRIEPTRDLFPEVYQKTKTRKARGKRKGLSF